MARQPGQETSMEELEAISQATRAPAASVAGQEQERW